MPTSKGRGCSVTTLCTNPVPMPSVLPGQTTENQRRELEALFHDHCLQIDVSRSKLFNQIRGRGCSFSGGFSV
jgi:hypothetical protein